MRMDLGELDAARPIVASEFTGRSLLVDSVKE
jgi:hypothetical protein